ncbi:MAG TPA: DUF502 domain-containing protein [Povalibacter sp.]|uniref:DUF502 domain-containing protein n=1 Tax=Povalibacter sp. TaxID=1962978 RepID=UPI002B73E6E5|nr:DUF502 domain-containing protein [Povalibacter sp.]HMN44985.1 DUF502 domain-containing protein [Povalibacter sp.]
MRRLWNTFLKGVAAILPVGLTIYVVYWLATTAESMLSGPLRIVLPRGHYWPGLGLLVAFLFVLLVGVLVDAYVVRRLFRFGESLLARIPIVKTIFGALKDFTRFLPAGGKGRDLKRVVLWRFGSARMVGFVTEDHLNPKLFGAASEDIVAVYFPMSYQIGGYTLYLHKSELEETQLSVEEAMRMVLIGGVTSQPGVEGAAR